MTLEESKNHAAYNVAPDPQLDIPEGEKPDLFEFLVSLPDVDVELTPIPVEEAEEYEEAAAEKAEKEKKAENLANRIRACSKVPQIISFSVLLAEDEGVAEVFEFLFKDENYKDILYVKGKKDTYYYSHTYMANSFAHIAANVVEEDDARTIAHSVREHSKYPSLSDRNFFREYPFHLSDEQIEQVRMVFQVDPDYEDIKEIEFNNVLFFYSTLHFPPGQALDYAQNAFMTKWGMTDADGNLI